MFFSPAALAGNSLTSLSGLTKCSVLVTLLASDNALPALSEVDRLTANTLLDTVDVR